MFKKACVVGLLSCVALGANALVKAPEVSYSTCSVVFYGVEWSPSNSAVLKCEPFSETLVLSHNSGYLYLDGDKYYYIGVSGHTENGEALKVVTK